MGNASGVLGGLSLGVVEVGWHGDDGVCHGGSEESLSDFFHLLEDHGRDLLRVELLGLALVVDDDDWLVFWSRLDLERPQLEVLLDNALGELSADQSLGIEDSVNWVLGDLILGSISNKSLVLGETDV